MHDDLLFGEIFPGTIHSKYVTAASSSDGRAAPVSIQRDVRCAPWRSDREGGCNEARFDCGEGSTEPMSRADREQLGLRDDVSTAQLRLPVSSQGSASRVGRVRGKRYKPFAKGRVSVGS